MALQTKYPVVIETISEINRKNKLIIDNKEYEKVAFIETAVSGYAVTITMSNGYRREINCSGVRSTREIFEIRENYPVDQVADHVFAACDFVPKYGAPETCYRIEFYEHGYVKNDYRCIDYKDARERDNDLQILRAVFKVYFLEFEKEMDEIRKKSAIFDRQFARFFDRKTNQQDV